MKGKKSNKNSEVPIIYNCAVVYDEIHENLEIELLDLEFTLIWIQKFQNKDMPVPDCLIEIYKDKMNNINNLLMERLHSDK